MNRCVALTLAFALLGLASNCSNSRVTTGNPRAADSGAADLPGQSGGVMGSGGSTGSGGANATGGAIAAGGATASGGATGTGGVMATGGTKATGGATSVGGTSVGGTTAGTAGLGTGGVSASGGRTGTGGNPGTGGSSQGIDAGGVCTLSCDQTNPTCCAASGTPRCTYLPYDPSNCGACGNQCKDATPYCNNGTCEPRPCTKDASACATDETCCGGFCCTTSQLCCLANMPIGPNAPKCSTISTTNPTCQGNLPVGSDRNIKKNIVPADTAAILAKVSRLPISTWTYKAEVDGLRHLGPMAQDFHASFGLGDDDRSYYPVDAHGVALASIQALSKLVQLQQDQIRKLEQQNANLVRRLSSVERAVTSRK